jgi:hypothetical protein
MKLFAEDHHILMMAIAMREGEPVQWTIHAKPCTSFDLKFSEPKSGEEAPKAPIVGGKNRPQVVKRV